MKQFVNLAQIPAQVTADQYENNRDTVDEKPCPKCHKLFLLNGFHRNKSKPDGRQANCKKCVAVFKRKKYLKKKRDFKFQSEIFGCLEDEAIVGFSDIFSECVLALVDNGKL